MEKLSSTPFAGKEEYKFVGKKKDGKVYSDCSVKLINNLLERNILTSIDEEIMNVLFRYKILNYVLIDNIIECNNLSKHLNKLREYGILLYYVNPTGQGVYMLSEGAIIFKELEKGIKYKRKPAEKVDLIKGPLVNRYICSNAAFINAHIRHENKMKKLRPKKTYLRKINIKGKFTNFYFTFVPVRRNEKNYDRIFEGLYEMEINSQNANYLVLVCEDFKHFDEMNDEINNYNVKIPCVLYVTDRGAYDNALDNLYMKERDRYVSINFSKM